jgi:type I restriction enzyme R subunit
VRQNDSPVPGLGDDRKQIAQELVDLVRTNTSVDRDKKERARALLRSKIRRLLTKYRYPPDRQDRRSCSSWSRLSVSPPRWRRERG